MPFFGYALHVSQRPDGSLKEDLVDGIRDGGQDDSLRVFVCDPPAGGTPQTCREGGIRGNEHRMNVPELQRLLPVVFELIGVGELIEEFLPV